MDLRTSTANDPYGDLQEATRRHRQTHRCGAYTYADGSFVGVIAAAVSAARVVEVGTALGYTACWLASATPSTTVDTIDNDPTHVELARHEIAQRGLARRIALHHGDASDVLATLQEGVYDLAFFDGFSPTPAVIDLLRARLRDGGLLVAANLTLDSSGQVPAQLADRSRWRTHSMGETALAVKITTPQGGT